METADIATKHAPVERASRDATERQRSVFAALPHVQGTLDAVPLAIFVLNGHRQVVHANRALLASVGTDDLGSVLGLRPGELLGCVHAASDCGCGCGTTESCRECGAVNAILASQEGRSDTRECRIRIKAGGEALDLRVTAAPFPAAGQNFTLFAVTDTGHEKRRLALERIFFHDILNLAGNLRGLAELLSGAGPEEALRYIEMVRQVSEELIEGIRGQAELASAERGDLSARPAPVEAGALLSHVAAPYEAGRAGGARVVLESDGRPATFVSDKGLLARVLGNMLKNAVEASGAGDTVRAGFDVKKDRVEFWVQNPRPMPRQVQLQVFQRSFSTKGPGRGLGTYSMKLLAERYLGGSVWFECSDELGTVFRASFPLSVPGDHAC